MTEALNIALGQVELVDGDITQNKMTITKLIEEANRYNIDIVCFPELSLTGYEFKTIKDVKTDSMIKQFFSELAKEHKIVIVAGISNYDDGKFYDSAAIWDENGKLIYIHNKIHLWAHERSFFEKGNRVEVIECKGWKIGIAVCADVGFPEISRIFALKNAEILIFPSAWASPYDDLWTLMLRARAAENQVWVVGVNRVGKGLYSHYCGCSMIVDPSGNIKKQFGNKEQGLLVENLSKNCIRVRRKEIPWLTYRVPELYSEIIKKYN
ncbi:MAG: carbon-nitrogen hydrolase family protein [Thermosediminibacteraceae bacterium]|nr:carbon-nitrogen hydrolase family protein [Thermosediminibacteraceae bacterium]